MLTWPSSASTVSTGSMPVWLALSASISKAMFLSGASVMGSSCRRKLAGPLVEQAQLAVRDGEIGAAQGQRTALFLLLDTGEGAQVGKADLDRGLLHCPLGLAAGGAELMGD